MAIPTPHEVNEKLVWLSQQLDQAMLDIETHGTNAVEAKHHYLTAHATAFMELDGSMELRKQAAILATADQRYALDMAEMGLQTARERLRTLRDQVGLTQSLGASFRAEMSMAGGH